MSSRTPGRLTGRWSSRSPPSMATSSAHPTPTRRSAPRRSPSATRRDVPAHPSRRRAGDPRPSARLAPEIAHAASRRRRLRGCAKRESGCSGRTRRGEPKATCRRPSPNRSGDGAEGEAPGGVLRFCGAAGASGPRPRRPRARSSTCSPPGEVRPEAVCVIVGSGWREARLVGGGARGAIDPVPLRGRRGALPAARGARRARLAADARRPDRRRGGRAGADPAAGGAPLDRPRAVHRDRPAPQARHDLGARGVARRAPSSRPRRAIGSRRS